MSKRNSRKAHRCECTECQEHPHSETAKWHRGLNRVMVTLDEKSRRLVAGVWALRLGHGGIQRTAEITGLSRQTIVRGQRETLQMPIPTPGRIRAPGGGRARTEKNSPAS